MSYQVFERKSTRIGHPAVTINPAGKIYFNQETAEWLRALRVKQVLLLWSSETSMVGVRAAKASDSRAYRLAYNIRGGGATITARSFLNWIGFSKDNSLLTVAVDLNEGQKTIEFEIPEECLEEEE